MTPFQEYQFSSSLRGNSIDIKTMLCGHKNRIFLSLCKEEQDYTQLHSVEQSQEKDKKIILATSQVKSYSKNLSQCNKHKFCIQFSNN